jgi:type IV pilus assembly protein PilY1
MKLLRSHTTWIMAGFAWALVAGAPALADDTELFVGTTGAGAGTQPNILLVIDTSGSMGDTVTTQSTYSSSTVYPGSCSTSRVYWSSGTSGPPNCGTSQYVDASYMVCQAAQDAFDLDAGRYTGTIAQYDSVKNGSTDTANRWETLAWGRNDEYVECEADNGVHGQATGNAEVYPRDNANPIKWTSNASQGIDWNASPTNTTYTLYEGNYLNWYYGPTSSARKIDIVKDVATDLVNSISGVNIGLMRFNNNEGGPIIHAVEDVASARSALVSTISSLGAGGFTPLSEVLYEAGLYYRGAHVDYGNTQGPPNSVAAARSGAPGTPEYNIYDSPIASSCQKNFIVMLTDGDPTYDSSANSKITGQPNYGTAVGGGTCSGSGDGRCLDEAAAYLYNADLISDTQMPDKQNVTSYMISFDPSQISSSALALLDKTAADGGGEHYSASDTASLSTVLTNIVTSILDTQTTFSAPAVAVNSFNRTRNLNDLFVAVFQPSGNIHWPGNLKKYQLDPDTTEIVDANGAAAVDSATGFFKDSSQSFWSTTVDGSSVPEGGAAHALPAPASRNVFTYLGNTNLTNASNRVEVANPLIDAALLGIGQPGDPTVAQLVSFARGADVTDLDGDGNTTEPRNQLGDPLHARPVTFIYGGTTASPDLDDAAVFFATNDGYLHAIDPSTGRELWTFIPPDFLQDLVLLYKNESTSNKHYGIDGNPVIQVNANDNGIIEPGIGETARLYFGMRRGGSFLYALDITNKTQPKFLWRLDPNSLPNAGQSWSEPVPTQVLVDTGAGQNAERQVLVLGGGYDTSNDNLAADPDVAGNAVYIVDSESGNLLWHASSSGSDLDLAAMTYAMPGNIRVIDLDSDDYADRLYAADMGGQVWRFDVFNGQPTSNLVTGGVIAQLGAAPNAAPTVAESRRFYYSPDVALINDGNQIFFHIGIGSGHRARPNQTATQDRFYALRDYLAFTSRTQTDYDSLTPIVDSDLIDITDDVTIQVPAGSPGWRFELRTSGGWTGEKVLAEARTFNNQILFTTFEPGVTSGSSCTPRLGTNRLYIVDVLTGRPRTNLDNSADPDNLTESDRYLEFNGTLSSEVVFLFPSPDDPMGCVGEQCTPPPVACVDLFCFETDFINTPFRTFWSDESTY